jgi:hypothetical protein
MVAHSYETHDAGEEMVTNEGIRALGMGQESNVFQKLDKIRRKTVPERVLFEILALAISFDSGRQPLHRRVNDGLEAR